MAMRYRKAVNTGIEVDGKWLKLEESFNFHDLKAKGVSTTQSIIVGTNQKRHGRFIFENIRKLTPPGERISDIIIR